MRARIELTCTAGFFALLATAQAQAPPQAAAGFDGTYTFVSSVKVTESFVGAGGRMHVCPDMKGGPVVIANGQARYFGLSGTVGSRGDLAMNGAAPATGRRGGVTYTVTLTGSIDGTGTLRARRSGYGCSYDAVLRK